MVAKKAATIGKPSATSNVDKGFTAAERAAMKERARQRRGSPCS
ncbi:MAG: hypothetical protein ACREPF_09475 [Rhodanobacteraceae bacterium]